MGVVLKSNDLHSFYIVKEPRSPGPMSLAEEEMESFSEERMLHSRAPVLWSRFVKDNKCNTTYVGYSRENKLIIYVFIQNQSNLVSGLGKSKACTYSMCLFKYIWGVGVWEWGVMKSPEYFLCRHQTTCFSRGKKIHICCQMGIKQHLRSVCACVCVQV